MNEECEMMNTNDEKTIINIDELKIFTNPFFRYGDTVTGRALYVNYLRHPTHHFLLKKIGDNNIFSSEEGRRFNWTRKECLESLACYFGYRNKITTSQKNILNIQQGIIVHFIDNTKDDNKKITQDIFNKYPEIYEKYQCREKCYSLNDQYIPYVLKNEKYQYPIIFYLLNFEKIKKVFSEFWQEYNNYFCIRKLLKKVQSVRKSREFDYPVYFSEFFITKDNNDENKKMSKMIKKYCSDVIFLYK